LDSLVIISTPPFLTAAIMNLEDPKSIPTALEIT